MRLSQAMRAGAKKGPQVFGTMFSGGGGSCALGAIILGMDLPSNLIAEYRLEVSATMNLFSMCPACTVWPGKLKGTIIHLNDHHGWPREDIADWIEEKFETELPMVPAAEIMKMIETPVPCASTR